MSHFPIDNPTFCYYTLCDTSVCSAINGHSDGPNPRFLLLRCFLLSSLSLFWHRFDKTPQLRLGGFYFSSEGNTAQDGVGFLMILLFAKQESTCYDRKENSSCRIDALTNRSLSRCCWRSGRITISLLSGTKHTLCGVHALPGGSPLSGKRTESARACGPWTRGLLLP